ncbi:CRISPR-associated helicase Cas3' [Streptomyces sampsonii]|nr:CRISPR-associated helicase Cas3' [Streptomyces sampsonii]
MGLAYPLLFHSLDAAAVAGQVWDRFLSPAQREVVMRGLGLGERAARAVVMLAAALHDLGKAGPFQTCEPRAWALVDEAFRRDAGPWRTMRHERASMHVGLQVLEEFGYRLEGNDSPAVRIAQVLGGHHGLFLQLDIRGAAAAARVAHDLGGPLWQETRRRYAWQVRRLTGAVQIPEQVSVEAAVVMTGIVQLADRLVSQPHVWMPQAQAPGSGALDHWMSLHAPAPEAPEGWAAHVVTQAGLENVQLPEKPFTHVHAAVREPSVLQASVIERLPELVRREGGGILFVADSTGTGKTAVAWHASDLFNRHTGTRGCTLLQPTTAIADAAYEGMIKTVTAHQPARAPVTLVHSHAWLHAAYLDARLARADRQSTVDEHYEEPDTLDTAAQPPQHGRPERKVTVPETFLGGFDRALLAPFAVATLDQALMAMLHTRHAALRTLALSGRTVIIDEAHAYSPYTRTLLCRLVHWLAAVGSSVIVLSATLRSTDARRIGHAYLTGAGHAATEAAAVDWTVPYPGWLFVPARNPKPARMTGPEHERHTLATRRTVHLSPLPVPSTSDQDTDQTDRLDVLTRLLQPMAQHGGCAAVSEPTVEDAQATYQHLKQTLPWNDPRSELVLLHARFPGHQREALVRRLRTVLGPTGPRPERLLVVTTSMLDMSLDLDLDLMITHLAELEVLLQRLGRLWRFEERWRKAGLRLRPAWARHPLMHVLIPQQEDQVAIPEHWGRADQEYHLHATAHLLETLPTTPTTRQMFRPNPPQPTTPRRTGRPSRSRFPTTSPASWNAYTTAPATQHPPPSPATRTHTPPTNSAWPHWPALTSFRHPHELDPSQTSPAARCTPARPPPVKRSHPPAFCPATARHPATSPSTRPDDSPCPTTTPCTRRRSAPCWNARCPSPRNGFATARGPPCHPAGTPTLSSPTLSCSQPTRTTRRRCRSAPTICAWTKSWGSSKPAPDLDLACTRASPPGKEHHAHESGR